MTVNWWHNLDTESLINLFKWTESQFNDRMQGSPIRRIGYIRWSRNIAVALGNALYSSRVIDTLNARRNSGNAMLDEHIDWAIQEQLGKSAPV